MQQREAYVHTAVQQVASYLPLHLACWLDERKSIHSIRSQQHPDRLQDPCGMMYDPTTETYHIQYQFHPNHVNWGNISWGYVNLGVSNKLTLTHLVTPHPRTW
jgi:sucrose-6-phosphate hydrolase SacC (GH32 family)